VNRLVYDEDELLESHDYARPHIEGEQLLHGGFDADGKYVSPRTLNREPAIDGWGEALRRRGGDLLAADASLLAGVRYPTAAQQKLLIREGLDQTFWNMLTITGQIEARGRVLAEVDFPDVQQFVVEDVSEMAIGHLNRGLLLAHGIDEGGEPERGIGGHDAMWFALRDLAFGETDYAEPETPELARAQRHAAEVRGLPIGALHLVDFLANLLLIEFRAERGFSFSESVLRDPELFAERRAEAERAAEIVGRIRQDEEIHVRSLRLYLGEIKELNFETDDGGTISGSDVVDALWDGLVGWATVDQPELIAEQQRALFAGRILAHPDGERILRDFNALEGEQ